MTKMTQIKIESRTSAIEGRRRRRTTWKTRVVATNEIA
jgi:hypothetical protein